MTFQKLEQKHGRTAYRGKQYILIRTVQRCGYDDSDDIWFIGLAVCPAEGTDAQGAYQVYEVHWRPHPGWKSGDRSDNSWACDWEAPSDIKPVERCYDLQRNRLGYKELLFS